jgi:hypothetical protein
MNSKMIQQSVNKKSSSSNDTDNSLVLMGIAGIAGIMGGAYMLYNTLYGEDELDEQELIQIEELKQNVEKHDGKITKEIAIKILYLTNHHAEEDLKKNHPDIESKRRACYENDVEYKQACHVYLEAKEKSYVKASEMVINNFNTTQEDLQKILEKVEPQEIEAEYAIHDKIVFKDGEKPDKNKAKEGFLYYGNKFMEEMQGLTSQLRVMQQNMSFNPQDQQAAQEMAMFSLMTAKMKCEDMLYNKFSLSENQIKFLIKDYDLMYDPDVMAVQEKISTFEKSMMQ